MVRKASRRKGPPPELSEEEAERVARALRPERRELLRYIGQRQYLECIEVAWILGVHQSNAYRALQDLKELGLVAEVPQRWDWQRGETRKPHAWYLGRNGAKAFARLWPKTKLRWDARTTGHHTRIPHTVRVNEIWARALQEAADPGNVLAGAGWLDEWDVSFRMRSGGWFRPDAYLLLRFAQEARSCGRPYQGEVPFFREKGPVGWSWNRERPTFDGWRADRAFFVEADTGTEDLLQVVKKALVYREAAAALRDAPCPVPAFGSVLIITKELAQAQAFVRGPWRGDHGEEHSGWSAFEDSGGWWVAATTWADLEQEGLLGSIWWTRQRSEPSDILALTQLRP